MKKVTTPEAIRLEQAINHRNALLKQDVIKEYLAFQKLPFSERQRIANLWEDYYRKCYQSPAGKNFRAMRDAFARQDMREIRERAAWARDLMEQGDFMPRPHRFEPAVFEYEQLCLIFRGLTGEIERLQKTVSAQREDAGTDF